MAFKTTLLRALRSAERVEVHGYEMDTFDYGGGELGDAVRIVICGGDYLFFFDGDQEVEINDGCCMVKPIADPEDAEDFGGMVEEEEEGLEEFGVCLEFKMMKEMTEEDLLL